MDVIFFAPSDVETFGKIDIKRINTDQFPLGIAYIASYIRKNGFSVKLVDVKELGENWKEKIIDIIKNDNPRFIGISSTTPQIVDAYIIADITKNINKDITTVIGGYHTTVLAEEVLKHKNIDIVVYGEGEITFLELLQNKKLSEIKGICYKENELIKKNIERELIKDLDNIPWPAYDLLSMEKYGDPYIGKCAIVITGRGCPFKCKFCASRVINKGLYRLRDIKKVVDEIEFLYKNYNIQGIKFVDDLFTLMPKRTIELCDELIKRKIKIRWMCNSRVDTINEEMLKKMKKAGCVLIKFGIESGDENTLKIVNKQIDLKKAEISIKMTKRCGIDTAGFFILGHPYETEETLKKTIDFAKKLPLDLVQFSMMIPYPGTEVYEMAKKKEGIELLNKDWSSFRRYGKPIIRLPTVSETKLEEYHSLAYRKFYLRPRYILNRLIKTHPRQYLNYMNNVIALLKFIKRSS